MRSFCKVKPGTAGWGLTLAGMNVTSSLQTARWERSSRATLCLLSTANISY